MCVNTGDLRDLFKVLRNETRKPLGTMKKYLPTCLAELRRENTQLRAAIGAKVGFPKCYLCTPTVIHQDFFQHFILGWDLTACDQTKNADLLPFPTSTMLVVRGEKGSLHSSV